AQRLELHESVKPTWESEGIERHSGQRPAKCSSHPSLKINQFLGKESAQIFHLNNFEIGTFAYIFQVGERISFAHMTPIFDFRHPIAEEGMVMFVGRRQDETTAFPKTPRYITDQ